MCSIACTDNEIGIGSNQVFRHQLQSRSTIFTLTSNVQVSVRNLWIEFDNGVNVVLVGFGTVELDILSNKKREEVNCGFWAKTANNTAS